MHSVNTEQIQLALDDGSWFDYWHAHDWNYENDVYPDSQSHIRELGELYESVSDIASNLTTDWQVWIAIHPDDSLQDAVYLHTPNPNSAFPADLGTMEWDCEIPGNYSELTRGRRSGRAVCEGEVWYMIVEHN